ncbi:nucleotide exchange factor GrpE [Stieleria sp. JC731]|uniref:nucleotide exchange factor GrpE n=1 Tax=Pirellulaceae TaxID=2691357 RepID=UPI001E3D5389|nr:nucleotide exchange factor GrpE [Stieleria sp. JC731]MCC9599844.1 nucleotide exchange factor GrpE [Stieleria sp. JC731]
MSEPIDPELEDGNAVESESADEQVVDEAFNDAETLEQPETRDEEMERLRRAATEADKRVLQAQAEAENFRKRMRRDFEDQIRFASTDLVVDLLQVRDNLYRAIEAANSGQTDGLQEGVAMVVKQMDDVFGKHGVTPIPTEGEEFDPNLHEAISQMPSNDVESGKIAHVAQSGFKLHERVIRPSQVVVSKGPA